MPSDLIVICNVQPLGPNYGDLNSLYFGINVSVATSDPDWEFTDDWLKPWQWKWPTTDVMVTSDHSTYSQVSAKMLTCSSTFSVASLRNTLNEYFKFFKKNPAQFQWDEKQRSLEFTSEADDATGATLKAFWHALLLDVATSPAPVPFLLNLSRVFSIPVTKKGKQLLIADIPVDEKTRLVACPEFTVGAAPVLQKQATPVFDHNGNTYRWDFKTAVGAPQVRARINDAAVHVMPRCNSSYIDLQTQWILRPENTSLIFDEDWMARSRSRLSLAVDLPQRILELFRNLKPAEQSAASGDPSVIRSWRNLFVATLYDISATSNLVAPDGQSLIKLLYSRANLKVDPPPPLSTTLADWRKLLKSVFPDLAPLAIMSPEGTTPLISPAEELAQWEQVHKILTDSRSLASLLAQILKNQGVKQDDLKRLLQISGVDFRERLLLGVSGPIWEFLTENARSVEQWRDLFPCSLEAYFLARANVSYKPSASCTNTSLPTLYKQYSNFAPQVEKDGFVIKDTLAKLNTWSKSQAETIAPGPVSGSRGLSNSSTDIPHALSLQLAAITSDPDRPNVPAATADCISDQDALSKIRGAGVLMRFAGKDWHCLNLASPYFPSFPPSDQDRKEICKTETIGDPIVVPSRLHFQDGVLQAFLSYDNNPVAGHSPSECLAQDSLTSGTVTAAAGTAFGERVIAYRHHSKVRVPAAIFGQTLQFMPFAVTNFGTLPAQIARDDDPCSIDLKKLSAEKLDIGLPTYKDPKTKSSVPYWREVKYLRRVPVGHLKFTTTNPAAARTETFDLPVIPDSVFPLARDIRFHLGSSGKFVSGESSTSEQTSPFNSDGSALILLAPSAWGHSTVKSLFNFWIRKPDTSLQTWDRWVGINKDSRKIRGEIWTRYFQRTVTQQAIGQNVTLEDPAVAGNPLVFQLYEIQDGLPGNKVSELWVETKVTGLDSSPLPPELHSAPVSVSCSIPADGSYGISSDNPLKVEIQVPVGKLCQLRIFATVKSSDYSDRFDAIYPDQQPVDHDGQWILVSPSSFLIETATDVIVGAAGSKDSGIQLWSLVDGSFQASPDRIQITVAKDTPLPYAGRAELRRQTWYWRGRPPADYPWPEMFSKVDAEVPRPLLIWEAQEFGDRSPEDYLSVSMKAVTTSRGSRWMIHEQMLGDDKRCSYHRMSVTVYSRYEGLIPPGQHRFVTACIGCEKDPVLGNVWKPFVVPCRVTSLPEAPKVRLILPLTEKAEDQIPGEPPGMLVVLRESWFQIGGLGEGLEATLETITQGANKDFLQLGNDPILYSFSPESVPPQKVLRPGGNEPPNDAVIEPELRGPVGHTFDYSSSTALFASSSFVVRAPRVPSTKNNFHPEWSFCKLRLRRVIPKEAFGDPKDGAKPLTSPETQPFWVQFLPDFSLVELEPLIEANVSTISYQPANRQLKILDASGKEFVPCPRKSDSNVFSIFLVLTRTVFDVAGAGGEERFEGMFVFQTGDKKWHWMSGPDHHNAANGGALPPLPPESEFRARILEVQRPSGASVAVTSEADFWTMLFEVPPEENKADGKKPNFDDQNRGRIVRISVPVSSRQTPVMNEEEVCR